MRMRKPFTLTELLAVIAIITILAGLLIPAVIIGQQRGRVTQAKADMKMIANALKSVENTYQQPVRKGGAYMPNTDVIKIGGLTNSVTVYDKFIVELTDPKNRIFNNASDLNINKRRITFLDPKSGYDPNQSGDAAVNQPFLWLDPWGNRYVLMIDAIYDGKIELPYENNKYIAGNVAIYSLGPNGEDEDGRNSAEGIGTGKADDIVSWRE